MAVWDFFMRRKPLLLGLIGAFLFSGFATGFIISTLEALPASIISETTPVENENPTLELYPDIEILVTESGSATETPAPGPHPDTENPTPETPSETAPSHPHYEVPASPLGRIELAIAEPTKFNAPVPDITGSLDVEIPKTGQMLNLDILAKNQAESAKIKRAEMSQSWQIIAYTTMLTLAIGAFVLILSRFLV